MVTGELHPLSISIKKVFKTMDKKMYFEPEMEVINLKLQGMLCGSDVDDTDGGAATDLGPLDPSDGQDSNPD